MKTLIGIDIGTSGTKTVLFDLEGHTLASHTAEYPLYQPQNGWAEQNPEDWWQATAAGLRHVLSGFDAGDVQGIGLSGQMHGLVMLDENFEVLRPAILWCDGRTGKQCAEITETVGKQRLIEITANPALPGFTAGKILWVRENEPDIYAKCRHILLPKDFIRLRLTGVLATEVSDASGMNLLDVPARDWSQEVLDKLRIPREWLPKMHESAEVTGEICEEAACQTGLRKGIPVVGGAGDNAAASIGTGVVREGLAFNTIGTSGVIYAHADSVRIDPEGRVHSFCHAVPGAWCVMSCTLGAGLSLQWFRNQFCDAEMRAAIGLGKDPYDLMNEQAARVPIGANRLLFLPYLMGERSPLLDENSRGVFFGLSNIHTRFDMLRAVMEGVAYSQRDCLEVLRGMGISPKEMLATGGGGRSPVWRQMLADLYGCDVRTLQAQEGPAFGVAILAGVGAGLYPSVQDACAKLVKVNEAEKPIAENSAKYEEYYRLYHALYPSMKEHFAALSTL